MRCQNNFGWFMLFLALENVQQTGCGNYSLAQPSNYCWGMPAKKLFTKQAKR